MKINAVFLTVAVSVGLIAVPIGAQQIERPQGKHFGGGTAPVPSNGQRLSKTYWTTGSLPFEPGFSFAAEFPPVANSRPVTAALPQGGIAPGLRGCGLLTFIPNAGPAPAQGENPIFNEGKALMADPRFAQLPEPEKQRFLGEWSALHRIQEKLVKEAEELTLAWHTVDAEFAKLDVLACRVKAKIDALEPALTAFNSTCQGTVDQGTYDWCMGEERRLGPLVTERDQMYRGLEAANGVYNQQYYYPTKQKSDAWGNRVINWENKVGEFNQAVKKALERRPPSHAECQTAIKLLTQYERLAQKFGIKIPPGRLAELDRLRDSGEIRGSDLPGTLQSEFPGIFGNLTLAEIREMCRGV